MRVFVLGTGRCGTMTFARACRHITNFTAAHESHRGRIADLAFRNDHIEVDAHLVHALPRLLLLYPPSPIYQPLGPGSAVYIHLVRERAATIKSLAKRGSTDAYARWAWQSGPSRAAAAAAMYDNANGLIAALVPDAYLMPLEDIKGLWRSFWNYIGADGDFDKSLAEWNVRYNASAGTVEESKSRRVEKAERR